MKIYKEKFQESAWESQGKLYPFGDLESRNEGGVSKMVRLRAADRRNNKD